MILLKSCTQFVSKFGKLSSGHRTVKGQFSFQSQRRAMPKNVSTTIQLHSCHMPARLWSKSFNLGFSSTGTKNFQMYRLCLEKAEQLEIKLPTFVGSWRKQGISQRNIYFCFDYAKVFDFVDHSDVRKILNEMGVYKIMPCFKYFN